MARAPRTPRERSGSQPPAPPPVPDASAGNLSSAVHATWPIAVIAALSLAAGSVGGNGSAPESQQAAAAAAAAEQSTQGNASPSPQPTPLLARGKAVQWWFAYKFSAQSYPGNQNDPNRACPFGGTLRHDNTNFSQHYVYATNTAPDLVDGAGLIGTSGGDPLGATFAQIYSGNYYYVVWNDQFYNDPARTGPECDDQQCGKPWGHSKGILAWDQNGDGIVLQVTTPSWPAAASASLPRHDGNTLGCISNDNNISNAQDFFALQLTHEDVKAVLRALATASVSTDVSNPQIVKRRLPGRAPLTDLDQIVATLGTVSKTRQFSDETLSSGVRLIAKPSALHVPPWQFVSSVLGGENLLTATWWANPRIQSTRSAADVHCWDPLLSAPAGRVDIALSSTWEGTPLAFTGGPNHAKIGASLVGGHHFAIFGDLNQQGQLGDADSPNGADCGSSQNGRGGMFFVVANPRLQAGVLKLIAGKVAAYAN